MQGQHLLGGAAIILYGWGPGEEGLPSASPPGKLSSKLVHRVAVAQEILADQTNEPQPWLSRGADVLRDISPQASLIWEGQCRARVQPKGHGKWN